LSYSNHTPSASMQPAITRAITNIKVKCSSMVHYFCAFE
jgi:hypothetical protein